MSGGGSPVIPAFFDFSEYVILPDILSNFLHSMLELFLSMDASVYLVERYD